MLKTTWIRCLLPALVLCAGAAAEPGLGDTRDTLARWVETQQIISRETREWQEGKEILEQRIALVEGEISGLEEKIASLREEIAAASGKRNEARSRSRTLENATDALSDVIGPLEQKTLQLVGVLPPPLREKLAPLSQRIPRGGGTPEASLSSRFANVLGILQEVNKFDRDVMVASEIRELPGGVTAEVKTLYVGLGQAYYVTADGSAAGVGHPGLEGWQWRADDTLAGEVDRAIAILQNEQIPAYVPLPVEIR